MWKIIVLYAAALAVATFTLQWLEYQYVMRIFSIEIYIILIAIGFAVLGIWIGGRLTRQPAGAGFVKNTAALETLKITNKEYETLEFLAAGHSNKEIARKMGVSPNTVKTHLARLYGKLEVQRRTQAIQKAKYLALIA